MPRPTIYAPFQENYIQNVKGNTIDEIIGNHENKLIGFYTSIPASKSDDAYADSKWTVKQVLSHVIDNDRIMAYRALALSRGERQTLPGYDQNEYMAHSFAGKISLAQFQEEFVAVRQSNLFLLRSFTDSQLQMTGHVSDYKTSVNSLCYVLFGHALHHMHILQERYGIYP